ncbi:MAG TPA: hypothetical protein VJH03_08655 [Blastocatellia bacterium]|nr:hypothetical protein [Blastocatellia bacterium]
MLNRRAVLIIFTLAMVAFIGWPTHAQNGSGSEPGVFRSDTLEMVVKAGFGKLDVNGFTGNWASFRIALANDGDPITGRLVVRAAAPSGTQHREYIQEVQLPRGSRQLHEIAAFLSSDDPPEVSVVSSDGRVMAQTTVRVERSHSGDDQLEIAVVDTDPTTLNNITSTEITRSQTRAPFKSGPRPASPEAQQADEEAAAASSANQPGPPPPGSPPRRVPRWLGGGPQTFTAHPGVIAPEDLPRDFVSYDAVDVVVIGDAPLSQLTDDQAAALRLWVAAGGMLIVTGGSDVAGLRGTGLDAMLPVEVHGASAASSIPELTDTYGRFESAAPPLLMSARARAGARVLLGTGDRVIAAERDFGSGLVRFVAINPKLNPYRGWAASKDLWTDLLLPAAEAQAKHTNWLPRGGARRNPGMGRWGVQNVLFNLAEITPPSSKYFLLFLLFYILTVGPLNYVALRLLRKLDLAWLTIPGVVLAFTAVSVTVAQVSRGGQSIAADVSLVEVHQAEGMTRVSGGLLIMPTSKDTHEVTLGGRNTFANDMIESARTTSASAADVIESERDRDGFTLRVPMSTWTSGTFQVRSMSEHQPAVVTIVGGGEAGENQNGNGRAVGTPVTLQNLGDLRISRAVYLSAAGISDLFDLESNQQRTVSLSAPQAATFTKWYSGQLAEGSREREVLDEFGGLLDREIGGQRVFGQGFFDSANMTKSLALLNRPLLIGFVDEGPTPITFRSSLKRRSKALYVVHL